MADIQINSPHPELGAPASQLIINGVDYSLETYGDADRPALMVVGEGDFAEVGLRVTLAVGSLKVNGQSVDVAGQFADVAAQISAILAPAEVQA